MKICLDSSVLIAHLGGDSLAKDIIVKTVRGEWEGFINPIVASETMIGFLRLATGVSARRIRDRLSKGDPKLLDYLPKVLRLLELFENLPIRATPQELVDIMTSYRLMPNDALIAITCRHHGISYIATFDKDFDRVPWLTTVPGTRQPTR